MDCIFCKIAKGEIPCQKLYEDSDFIAFLDIHPSNKGHLLLVPKQHFSGLLDMPENVSAKILATAKKVAAAAVKGLGADGFNLTQNNGSAAGQVVMHFHFHIIPRFKDDGLRNWPPKKTSDAELNEVAGRIRKNLG
ncbi:MAG: HIT family protein [Candidatus Woesearchaeota archaeon]